MLSLNAYAFSFQIWVRWGDRVMICYRAHPTQKYPYIYPVTGPATGSPLTTESGARYPHHRSLWFACDRVGEGNFWQEGNERGQILSRGPQLANREGETIHLQDVCDWRIGHDPPLLKDEREFRISMPHEGMMWIDAYFHVTALQDVHIGRTNHSLFALRVAPDLAPSYGGTLVNSEGLQGESGTFGQVSAWCDFYAQRGDVVEGIALIEHPSNPWESRWFTRDYGFCSPTPIYWLGEKGYDLAVGHSLELRYRVVAHVGTPQEAGIETIYEAWSRA